MSSSTNTLIVKFIIALTFLFIAIPIFAHRVNIFADINRGVIEISCFYSKDDKVNKGNIKIYQNNNNSLLFEGFTDENGSLNFNIPEEFYKDKAGIRIVLDAGMGHRAEWDIPYEEIANSQKILETDAKAELKQKENANTLKKEREMKKYQVSLVKIVYGVSGILCFFVVFYFVAARKRF